MLSGNTSPVASEPANLCLRLISMAIAFALAGPTAAFELSSDASGSARFEFDANFFPSGNAPALDVSRFAEVGYVPAGTYRADILLNGVWRARTDVTYAADGDGPTHPCFDAAVLESYGIDLSRATTEAGGVPLPQGVFCKAIGDVIPGAQADFDVGRQELTLSVPQAYVARSSRGYVPPADWDSGINATVVNYHANAYSSQAHGTTRSAGYLGVNAAVSLGSWHLLNSGSLSYDSLAGASYQNIATRLEHDIPSIRASLSVIDVFTPGDMFDSLRLRGVTLRSDDRMLPQSLRGYAPVVQGVAESNAKVTVRQRGFIIYQTSVAPGPFVIDDLYPTGYGGDLEVQVLEANGQERVFYVPYASMSQLLRPGMSRWSVSAGQVNELGRLDQPDLLQGTYQRGLTNSLTMYGGIAWAQSYRATLLGSAFNTRLGAFSADVTHADAGGEVDSSGFNARMGYNKNLVEFGTNFTLAAYRYSTRGYLGLHSLSAVRDAIARGNDPDRVLRERARLDLSVSQKLGERGGQLYASGSAATFWGSDQEQVSLTAGYSGRWRDLTYSLTGQWTREAPWSSRQWGNHGIDASGGGSGPEYSDRQIALSVSVPLGKTHQAPMLRAGHTRLQNGGGQTQLALNGSAWPNDRASYGAAVSEASGHTALSLNAQYRGDTSHLMAGYDRGHGYTQVRAGATGGVVLHGGGVTFGPPLGDTVGLVHAANATGATLRDHQGSAVDRNGYALVPNLTPYELNTVTIDPKGSGLGVSFKQTSQRVAPRAGTVVMLPFEASYGRALLVDTTLQDGRPVPFGADVLDDTGNSVGTVGQAGRAFITGATQSGSLTVRWGDGPAEACKLTIELGDPPSTQDGFERQESPCAHEGG